MAVDPTFSSVFAADRANRTATAGDPAVWASVDSLAAFRNSAKTKVRQLADTVIDLAENVFANNEDAYLHMLLAETLQLLELLLHLLLVLRHQVLLLDLILLVRQALYVRLNLAQAVIHATTNDTL